MLSNFMPTSHLQVCLQPHPPSAIPHSASRGALPCGTLTPFMNACVAFYFQSHLFSHFLKKSKNVLKSLPSLQKSLPSTIQSRSFVERILQPPSQELLKMWPSDFLTPCPLLFLQPKSEQASRAQSSTCMSLRLSSIDFTTGPSLFSPKLHSLLHYFIYKKKKKNVHVCNYLINLLLPQSHCVLSGGRNRVFVLNTLTLVPNSHPRCTIDI